MSWFPRKRKRCRNTKGKSVISYSTPKDYDLICSRFLSLLLFSLTTNLLANT